MMSPTLPETPAQAKPAVETTERKQERYNANILEPTTVHCLGISGSNQKAERFKTMRALIRNRSDSSVLGFSFNFKR